MKKTYFLICSLIVTIILIGGYIQQPKKISFDALKTCTSDEECIIINSLNECPYCDRDDICGEIDYSKSKYIAVNSELLSNWQAENCPSKEECLERYGPLQMCPVTEINVNFEAKCVDNICEKLPK